MGRGLAAEVSGIELLDGGVEVVELEQDDRRMLIVRVDFDDAQHLVEELPGPAAFATREARKDEALPTRCDNDGPEVSDSDVDKRPQACNLGIPTVLDPSVYDSPAI